MAREKSVTVLECDEIHPFVIHADKECFTLSEKYQSNAEHRLSKGKSKEKLRLIGYYSKFSQCMERILRQKQFLGQEYTSLKEYVDEYKQIQQELINYLEKNKLNDQYRKP